MHKNRATYDENGDIILPEDDAPVRASVRVTQAEEEVAPPKAPSQLKKATRSILLEGRKEWHASVKDAATMQTQLKRELRAGFKDIWKSLQQPVWIPGRKGQPKKYTRGTLFIIDTVRFGVTFAGIFGLLFLSLNYQSFLTIAQATLDPLAAASAGDVLQTELAAGGTPEKAPLPMQKSVTDKRSLLAMLPQVGPPDDRIIIPKLNLNVPIVIPSSNSLVREDWKQLELDIQDALAKGVVHYPGTARPGQAGNFFVTGHSSYYPWAEGHYKSVFARLGELKIGDEYWVYYGGDKHRYRIEGKKEVSPSDVSVLDQPTDMRRSTLMTCTPVGTTLRRLIVSAQELHVDSGEPIAVGEHEKRKDGQKLQMEQLPI